MALAASLAPPAANALEVRRAKGENTQIVIGADEVVDDSLLAAAETVIIEGTVTGNLLAFGRTVDVHGEVQGDVLSAAENVEAAGRVGGNWLSFSRSLHSTANISRSLIGFGEDVEVRGQTGGDLIAFASRMTVMGSVFQDAFLFGKQIDANGSVGGDLSGWAGKIELGPQAAIDGDLTAHVEEEDRLSIDPGATIAGAIRTVGFGRDADRGGSRLGAVAGWALSFLAALATGLVVYWLFPGLLGWRAESPQGVAVTAGIGFLMLVATPIAALIAAITVIGLPVGLILGAAYAAAIYLAKIALAPAIGVLLLHKEPAGRTKAFVGALALGLGVFWVLKAIPILGGLASFVVVIVGLGALGMRAHGLWQGPSAPAVGSPA